MSDDFDLDFEGGFFDEAGVDANEIPDDQFGFGNDFWPIYVAEAGKPKVTQNGDKIGMSIRFAVDHPRYANHWVSGERGLGNQWYRLPVPLALRDRIHWDPNGEDEQKAMFQLKQLYKALGFGADEFGKVNEKLLQGRRCLAKIKPIMDDNSGYWNFRLNSMKSIPTDESGEGMNQFAKSTGNSGNSAKTAEELAAEELKRELG
jgi:hypothetical protein